MRLPSLMPFLPGLLLAVCTSFSSAQIIVSPVFPQAGNYVSFTSLQSCGGYWEIDGSGDLAGAFQNSGGSNFGVNIPPGAAYAGSYQVSLDPGGEAGCSYNVADFVVTDPGLSMPKGLSGHYSFLCHGHLPPGQGSGTTAAAGAFIADGAGKFSGVFDYNSASKTLLAQAITGTYALDSTGTGQLAIKTPVGTANYAVLVNPSEIANGAPAYAAAMVEQDTEGENSSCNLSRVEYGTYFTPLLGGQLYGGNLLQLTGEPACYAACGAQPFVGNALLSLNGDGSATSIGSITGAAFTIKNLTLSGRYTTDSTSYRTTLMLSTPGETSGLPTHYVVYPADAVGNSIYLLSTDPHATFPLLIGLAVHSGLPPIGY